MKNKNLKKSVDGKSRKILFILILIGVAIVFFIILGVFSFTKTKYYGASECREKKYVEERMLVTDKELLNIEWETKEETRGVVVIKEQEKVNEILKRAFSCDFETKVFLVQPYIGYTQKMEEEALQKYGCSYSLFNRVGVPVLNYNGKEYPYFTDFNEDTKNEKVWNYISNILLIDEKNLTRRHSVAFDILKPNISYNFEIISTTNNCPYNSEAAVDVILVNNN